MRILVVDDESKNIKLLEDILACAGYEVASAGDGQEAFAQMKAQKPDLIILDILLPGANGWQLCQQFKDHPGCEHVPIIMFSSLIQQENFEGDNAGSMADGYLAKPFDPLELLRIVERLLKHRRKE